MIVGVEHRVSIQIAVEGRFDDAFTVTGRSWYAGGDGEVLLSWRVASRGADIPGATHAARS
jgi:hypothetical protein